MSYLEPIDTRSYSYDEWLRFAFDHPIAKEPWYYSEAMHFECDPRIVLGYYTRLFRDPTPIASYDDAHLEQGFWFIVGSQLAEWLWNDEISYETAPRLHRRHTWDLSQPLCGPPSRAGLLPWWNTLRRFEDHARGGPGTIVKRWRYAAIEQYGYRCSHST